MAAMIQAELVQAINEVGASLAPFMFDRNHAIDEKALNQIFVFNEKGDHLELHENNIETGLTIEASHEVVKAYFIDQLTTLYGEAAVNVLYPKNERAQPLTLEKSDSLIRSLVALQDSVIEACREDLSQYDNCLSTQLKTLEELKLKLANPPPPNPLEASMIDSLSRKTGFSPYMISAGFVAGGVLAAATSGLSFPVAFHAAMTAAAAHAPMLGASATVGALGNQGTALLMGMSINSLVSQCGTAVFTTLSHITTPIATGVGTGALMGAIGGGIGAAGSSEHPSSSTTIVRGMLGGAAAGGLLGGLSVAFTPTVTASCITGLVGGAGALRGTVTGGSDSGRSGAILGAIRGAAAGVAAGAALGSAAAFTGLVTKTTMKPFSSMPLSATVASSFSSTFPLRR
jgi:hypothetical protein